MTETDETLGARIARARERLGFSQEDVAALVGQQRTVVSAWESGRRRPNAHQLDKLSQIFRLPLGGLKAGSAPLKAEFEQLFFRDAGDRLDAVGRYEVVRFLTFLDEFGVMLDGLEEPPGLTRSPLALAHGFSSKDDVRRKAEDARRYLAVGDGPIANLSALADLKGISVYRAPLGADLRATVSGAFVPHGRVGFAVLINAETTPGRQQFTLAHELGHALFHGTRPYVDFFGRREASERFADQFAAEFLVPIPSLRAAVEQLGETGVRDPEVAVHLQRLFRVSYAMMLVRLRAANLVTPSDLETLRTVRPVHVAERLGYSPEPDEWGQDPERWGLARFPQRFLRLLRRALAKGLVTVGGAASMTGLAHEDIEEFLADHPVDDADRDEFEYLSDSA